MVYLKEVTAENLDEVLRLEVRDDQKSFVSSPAVSLAQAYVYHETAFPFAVYYDQQLIGFIMMGYYEEKHYYTLWKLLIDQKYQNRGYGRKALEMGIALLKDQFQTKEIYTGVTPSNRIAKKLYASVGFVATGNIENNMEEMRLEC